MVYPLVEIVVFILPSLEFGVHVQIKEGKQNNTLSNSDFQKQVGPLYLKCSVQLLDRCRLRVRTWQQKKQRPSSTPICSLQQEFWHDCVYTLSHCRTNLSVITFIIVLSRQWPVWRCYASWRDRNTSASVISRWQEVPVEPHDPRPSFSRIYWSLAPDKTCRTAFPRAFHLIFFSKVRILLGRLTRQNFITRHLLC